MAITAPYTIIDYTAVYKPIMQFNKNKTAFIHQWYPFVEGYSKEFITTIIDELDYEPKSPWIHLQAAEQHQLNYKAWGLIVIPLK